MIKYVRGDIFSSDAEAITNPVNAVGVSGAGLAYQFKRRYPENQKAYEKACLEKRCAVGRIFVHKIKPGTCVPRYIVNFATKRHWRENSELYMIAAGLKDLVHLLPSLEIRSIALPALGCGYGGLPWPEVRALLDEICVLPEVEVTVYEPH